MVATAALLARLQLPGVVQGFWTERGPGLREKSASGRWKPEGSDVYARSYGGRVAKLAKLHKSYAEAARMDNRYVEHEKEIGETLIG